MSEETPKPVPAPEPPLKPEIAVPPPEMGKPAIVQSDTASVPQGTAPSAAAQAAGTTAPVGAQPNPAAKATAAADAKPADPAAAKTATPAPSAKPAPATAEKPAPVAQAKPAAPPPPPPATYPRTPGVTFDAAPKASLKRFLGDAFGLLKGMGVTFGYIRKPSRVVTRQYPENRGTLKMTERFRGQVVMPHDEQGDHTCTACTLCEKACPNGSISILTTKNIASKRVLGAFVYRLSSCTLCNLCIEACPFDAIRMGHGFEMATFSRDPLDLILNKKEGR